jgi:hypothetical protein
VPVTVLEESGERVGGLARTERYKGFHFDIGGHRFFSKSREIEDLWTEILGDEMLVRGRLSRIFYRGRFFDYPLKVFNVLVNLGPVNVIRALASYVRARLRPIPDPKSFEDWIINSFGRRLYETFFKTYTEKVWAPCSGSRRLGGAAHQGALDRVSLGRRFCRRGAAPGGCDQDAHRAVPLSAARPGQMWGGDRARSERAARSSRRPRGSDRAGEASNRLRTRPSREASEPTKERTLLDADPRLDQALEPPAPAEYRASQA